MLALTPDEGEADLIYGLLAARYLVDKGLLVQGLTLLRESMLDLVVLRLGAQEVKRAEVDALLGGLAAVGAQKVLDHEKEPESVRALSRRVHEPPWLALGGESGYRRFCKMAAGVTAYRNAFDHAGTKTQIGATGSWKKDGLVKIDEVLTLTRTLLASG